MSDVHVARLRGMGPASWTRTPWTSRRRRTGAICEPWCGWSIAITAKAAECTGRGLAFSWLLLWRLKLVVCTNCHDRLPASLRSCKLAFKECLVSAVASSVWRVLWLVFILVKRRAVCCCQSFLARRWQLWMASARSLHRTSFFLLAEKEKILQKNWHSEI